MSLEDKIKQKGKLEPSLYYINEEGLLVFTEEYHLRRGHCCGKTCKHCPFEPVGIKGNKIKKNDNSNV
jgi:hypothetical protein